MTLLAIDQGTTGTTALLFDLEGRTLGRATCEFPQYFPEPGWVEHEPDEIWSSVVDATTEALRRAGLSGDKVRAIGITNQRETTLLWNRATSAPVHRALVWQDRRTADHCAALRRAGHEPHVRDVTGLVLDPYFSATKLAWLLAQVPGARVAAEAGKLAFGTVDSYLLWRLSGGSTHATDVTNASRTLLMNVRTRMWEEKLLTLFGVPRALLPTIVPSAGALAFTRGFSPLPDGTPVCGVAGDQQAALFGQRCFAIGDAKCTYGTGAFVLVTTGDQPVKSQSGALTTVAWQIGDTVTYALEGASFVAGAAVQWLRDGLGLIKKASEIEALARSVPSSDGVVFVPALTGLGAPRWDPHARGLITGLTRGTTAAHLARATLEGIAFGVGELLAAMAADIAPASVEKLRVDGGAAANDLLLQLQSDFSSVVIERPTELESTARGAAMLAGIGANLFPTSAEAGALCAVDRLFTPEMNPRDRQRHWDAWAEAMHRAGPVGGGTSVKALGWGGMFCSGAILSLEFP